MCCIAGSHNEKEVEGMLSMMKHRAPDGSGITKRLDFTVGMGRLAIIDLKSENLCPFTKNGITLVYNGEVYNYKELREELKLNGYVFDTESDIEVVFNSYLKWGVNCLNKFNGMFAFAIMDGEQIFLARDIAGEKPLYYREKDFAFASEAKVFRKGSNIIEPNFFESLQHCIGDTLYEGVKELLPAHYAIYNITKKTLQTKRWWEFKPRYINSKTALEELRSLLESAVELRTRSDVPYALYYSGGVDSGLISKCHRFEKITYDYNTNEERDFKKNIKKIVHHLDFPVGSFSSYPLFCLAREAKKRRYKVVISGEGADEIFGGYIRYLPIATQYFSIKRYPSYSKLLNRFGYKHEYAQITGRRIVNEELYPLMDPFFDNYDPITAMQLFDFTYILPSLLQMGDRMASMFGIENRCPFLDRRIIEFGLSLPSNLKINNLETKVLLRDLLDLSDAHDIEKEKRGLTFPYNKWNKIEGWDRSHYFNEIKKIWVSI